MFSETDNIIWNIPILRLIRGIFYIILSVPLNIIMDLNNVMKLDLM